jgi:prolipoprotein diacylglyceryltransferase
LALVYIIWRYRGKLIPGLTTSIYFISYSVVRFLLEFIRLDAATVGPIAIAQIVALLIIAAFAGFLVYQVRTYRRGGQSTSPQGEEQEAAPTPEGGEEQDASVQA